jgi:hypothetical protein
MPVTRLSQHIHLKIKAHPELAAKHHRSVDITRRLDRAAARKSAHQ